MVGVLLVVLLLRRRLRGWTTGRILSMPVAPVATELACDCCDNSSSLSRCLRRRCIPPEGTAGTIMIRFVKTNERGITRFVESGKHKLWWEACFRVEARKN